MQVDNDGIIGLVGFGNRVTKVLAWFDSGNKAVRVSADQNEAESHFSLPTKVCIMDFQFGKCSWLGGFLLPRVGLAEDQSRNSRCGVHRAELNPRGLVSHTHTHTHTHNTKASHQRPTASALLRKYWPVDGINSASEFRRRKSANKTNVNATLLPP